MSYKQTSPRPIIQGATNATTMATTDGTVYYDGTRLVTTATGTAAQVLTSNGAGVAPTYQAFPSASGTIVTKFTTSGTWTINAATKWVDVYTFGGGGGGGSGRQGLSGTGGGGGGGGGAATYQRSPAQAFNAGGETVTIGAGGTGGATQGSINSNGIAGGNCTVSSLGNINNSISTATAGLGGHNPGFTTMGFGGQAMVLATIQGGVVGGDGDPSAGSPDGQNIFLPLSGAGGGAGGAAGTVTPIPGGNGGQMYSVDFFAGLKIAGGVGGTSGGTINGTDGNPGAASNIDLFCGGTGGGGGGGQAVAGGLVAGNAGNGGIPGGGGGGGGASINGVTSGTGGNGGRGEVWVVEYK